MTQQFLLADTLSDAQVDELVQHGSVSVGDFLYTEWRKDNQNQTWLKRVSTDIHGVEPDVDICADGFVDAPADNDPTSDDPIEFSMDYGSDDDE